MLAKQEPKFNSWELLVRFMADTVQGPGTAAAWDGVAARGAGWCSWWSSGVTADWALLHLWLQG